MPGIPDDSKKLSLNSMFGNQAEIEIQCLLKPRWSSGSSRGEAAPQVNSKPWAGVGRGLKTRCIATSMAVAMLSPLIRESPFDRHNRDGDVARWRQKGARR